jgi:hypothetical protein
MLALVDIIRTHGGTLPLTRKQATAAHATDKTFPLSKTVDALGRMCIRARYATETFCLWIIVAKEHNHAPQECTAMFEARTPDDARALAEALAVSLAPGFSSPPQQSPDTHNNRRILAAWIVSEIIANLGWHAIETWRAVVETSLTITVSHLVHKKTKLAKATKTTPV